MFSADAVRFLPAAPITVTTKALNRAAQPATLQHTDDRRDELFGASLIDGLI